MKDPNMIRLAFWFEVSFIKLKVVARKNTPHTVATTALVRPVKPNTVGINPNGNKNKV